MKNRIREVRTELAWSQELLAEKTGVSRQTINAIENDRYDPMLPLAFPDREGVREECRRGFSAGCGRARGYVSQFRNTVMMIAFVKSMKKAPTSGTTRNGEHLRFMGGVEHRDSGGSNQLGFIFFPYF